MTVFRPPIITAATVTGTSASVSAAKTRNYLGLFNQSASDTVSIAFGSTAAANATAGSIDLTPTTGARSFVIWDGSNGSMVPSAQVNAKSSGSSTALTIVE